MADNTFLGSFVTQYARLILPLKEALESESKFRALFLDLGWSIPTPPVSEAQAVVNNINSLIDSLDNLPSAPSEIDMIALLADVSTVYLSIKNFANTVADTTSGIGNLQGIFKSEFPNDLFNYLICRYLQNTSDILFNTLLAVDIISYTYISEELPRPAYTKIRIDYSKLGTLITNPTAIVKEAVEWNTEEYDFENIGSLLMDFLSGIKIPASFLDNPAFGNELTMKRSILYNDFFNPDRVVSGFLSIFLMDILVADNYKNLNAYISAFEGEQTNEKGIILELDIPEGTSLKQDITNTISLQINTSDIIGNNFGVQLSPSEQKFSYLGPTSFNGKIELLIRKLFEGPVRLFGQPEGTRLEIRDQAISLFVKPGTPLEYGIGYDLSGLALVIDPNGSDNFIKNIFGDKVREIKFPITVQWSNTKGISFVGSGTFEFEVNTHFKIGPIEFTNVKVAIKAPQGQNKVTADIGTNIKGDLSAIVFTVDNIGLRTTLNLDEGNAGPFGIGIGFKPPTGVGLSIDAPPVKGGGFLNYDESTSTYTGGLELQFSKISFSAIGIISTKLPGGEKGYSLLVIVSVEFTPLQIGMGFTINGIGGLLGLHRTSNPDVLRAGIRYNTLDHILFPKNIVENANTIISNLGQAFPIRKDQFMLGPMAKIGWGTPTLLTIDIGIVIELPDPVRLIILGILRAQLPSAQNPILQIQVNFLGIIDFKEKYLSFDATLYDSKILTFGLFGDMALRLNWGDRPNFLLSVGGFHPSYTPPPLNLPSMQRLTIILADHSNLKISVESYFAVTSNSAQFGARVYAMAKAWKIIAEGELWFNVLFQFSPFYFAADMGVKFAIKMGSKTLLGIYVALMLEGPDPWRAQGQAAFKILLVKVKVRFDATFGRQRAEAIEAVKVDDKIKEALMLQDNWEALLPDQNNQMVAWRKEGETEVQSVDPSGAIKISQRVMPLNTMMQKFGSAAISDFNQYRINTSNVRIENMIVPAERVQDYFARSEFSNMTDEEKLSRDGYELFDSGVLVGSNKNQSSQYAVHKHSTFEEITMDSGYRRKEDTKFAISDERLKIDSFLGYTTRTGLSRARLRTTSVGPAKIKLSIKDGEFVLANRNNLQQVGGGISFANSMDAERYLKQQKELSPTTVENWIIANRYELA
ncbi:hypothetical protein SAMN05421741_1334 [Paenimyroides ummariense]|uniref:DUF6603 domain-containing protein n=1 Tax=Paenimyroides ummariense TaxID=913024 RepID=A0A1I5FY62_9FLAO|nr:DUF6603 domain-containing protein [Paenimyroides ummariense]SFO28569.1 hypothetical protein SAMN05421741_1334 [Paenimyroides ummariense]